MAHFSNSLLLNIYNLLSQVYALAKFYPCMPTTFGVTALQSSNNRKIDLYSKYWENTLHALTKRLYLTNAMQYGVATCTIVFAMNRGVHYWVSCVFYYHSSLHTEMKSVKKNRSHTIVST